MMDRQVLNRELIRLHVVASSDSPEDQSVKLRVRDAVLKSIQADLADISDVQTAKSYLQKNLPKLQYVANQVLEKAGVDDKAIVNLCREAFDTRYYDTFKLPAGVYHTLRITIGEGDGQNWWCVAFPELCLCATVEAFEETAVETGLSVPLSRSLTEESGYEVHFFLLDAIGKLENILFTG